MLKARRAEERRRLSASMRANGGPAQRLGARVAHPLFPPSAQAHEWARNAASLSGYYCGEGQYAAALAVAAHTRL